MNEKQTMEERFEDTNFAKNGGCWLECSDFEGSCLEMKDFVRSELKSQQERLVGEINEMKDNYRTRKRATPFQDTLFGFAVNILDEVIEKTSWKN
ncbi:MAG: hypothetical protein WC711_04315 [Candidatus Staskawiczbacteria bacterium]|jgi:hypothetical protein